MNHVEEGEPLRETEVSDLGLSDAYAYLQEIDAREDQLAELREEVENRIDHLETQQQQQGERDGEG